MAGTPALLFLYMGSIKYYSNTFDYSPTTAAILTGPGSSSANGTYGNLYDINHTSFPATIALPLGYLGYYIEYKFNLSPPSYKEHLEFGKKIGHIGIKWYIDDNGLNSTPAYKNSRLFDVYVTDGKYIASTPVSLSIESSNINKTTFYSVMGSGYTPYFFVENTGVTVSLSILKVHAYAYQF